MSTVFAIDGANAKSITATTTKRAPATAAREATAGSAEYVEFVWFVDSANLFLINPHRIGNNYLYASEVAPEAQSARIRAQ